jgi:putative membrane protein insertion efficiency factor
MASTAPMPANAEAVAPTPPSLSPPARFERGAIRLYQRAFAGRPSPCRYIPTCSQYAVEAVETHGAGRGTWLAVRRLLRCQPWGGHGLDPVPPARHHSQRSRP